MSFAVLDGGGEKSGYTPEADVGSKSWQGRIRQRAKLLAEQVESGYLELGEILYRIYDAPVNGDPNGGAVLAKWGYSNIGEYAEKELNLHAKKAQRLVRIFYRVEVELNGFDSPELRKRFVRLGWSKARELVRILTKTNAEEWITKAEQVNYTTVVELVRREAARQEALAIKADIAKQPDPIAESNRVENVTDPEVLAALPPVASGPAHPRAPARPVGDYGEAAENPLLVNKKWVSKVFQLEASQAETVNLALKRAQDLAGNIKKSPSTLISLVCLDFLSGADWKGGDLESKLRFLAKIERSIGLRLVVVDDDDQVVYGLKALQAAAKKANTPDEE